MAVFWMLCASFGLGSIFSGSLGTWSGGLAETWNRAANTIGYATGWNVLKLTGGDGGNLLFLLTLLLLCIITAWLLLETRKRWLLSLFVLLLVLSPLCMGISPAVGPMCALTTGWGIAMPAMSDEGLQWTDIFFWGVTALLLCCLFFLPGVAQYLQKPDALRQVSQKLEENAGNAYYGQSPLAAGDATVRERRTGEETALLVTMDAPDSLYLRGFVGEVFNGNNWSALSTGLQYESRDLFYWLNADGFTALGQLGLSYRLTLPEGEEASSVRVQVKNADRRYAYVPYEITEADISGGNKHLGSCVHSGGLRRLSDYTYTATSNAVKNWTTVASRVFTQENPDLTAYLTDESYYNAFVYENDTFLSQQSKALMETYLGSAGNQSSGHVGYKAAIEKVRTYLEENFVYTEDMGAAAPESGTALQDFFSVGKGFDVQYATAAAMMFRYYGIPARYVEGYLITPDMARDATGGEPMAVSRENAHAWVEIYVDGVGFVPIEVCPPYRDMMEEADLTVGIANDSVQGAFEEITTDNSSGENVPDQGGDANRSWEWLLQAAAILLLSLLLLFLALTVVRRLLPRIRQGAKRRRVFYHAPAKTAVSAIYGYMALRGLPLSEETVAIGDRAAYSPYPVGEAERLFLLEQWKKEEKERKAAYFRGKKNKTV